MKIVADLHTHTSVSDHAYSSLREMAQGARRAGLVAIGITNHGPAMEDGAHQWHFANLDIIPRQMEGVTVIRGVELNICAPDGHVDEMGGRGMHAVEFALASFHDDCYPPATRAKHTEALEAVLHNPQVNALGHPGNNKFPFDMEYIISRCNEYGKIVEINNNSLHIRPGSRENCAEIARLCKNYEVPVVVNSDSHIEFTVGRVDGALAMLEEIGFPEELVINSSVERLNAYFTGRGIHLF